MEEEVPGNGGWAKDGEAEEPARVAGESVAGRKGTRRSEKAKVSGEFDLGFVWVVVSAVGWVGVWGFWAGPGLVWMGCVVFAMALLWGAGHQSSNTVCCCW